MKPFYVEDEIVNNHIFKSFVIENEFKNGKFHKLLKDAFDSKLVYIQEKCKERGYTINSLGFYIGRSYSCVRLDWHDVEYPNHNISIDIVPVFPITDKIPIVQLVKQHSEKDSYHCISIKSEFAKAKFTLSLSKWENKLIKDLSSAIRLGYKLAKKCGKLSFFRQ